MKPQAVVFDIGNVLLTWDPEGFYDRTIGPARRRALFGAVDLHGMNLLLDGGALFRPTVYDWAARYPEWETEIRWWHDRWDEMASPFIDGSIALVHALKARGVPVFTLTNFGGDSFDSARERLTFLALFDRHFVSGHLKVTKPDPAIYAHVERDSGIAPDRLLFADDRADNITAAARRGWRTHQFETWQGFARRLVAEDLLTPQEAGL